MGSPAVAGSLRTEAAAAAAGSSCSGSAGSSLPGSGRHRCRRNIVAVVGLAEGSRSGMRAEAVVVRRRLGVGLVCSTLLWWVIGCSSLAW